MLTLKRIGALATIALALATAAPAAIAQATSNDYFPLARGSTWTYAINPPPGTRIATRLFTNTVDRTRTQPLVGTWSHLTSYQGADHWVLETSVNRVYETPAELWYRLGVAAGTSWTMQMPHGATGSNGATLTLASRTEAVTVPAGTFARCIRIDYTSRVAGAIESEWFAPGVGLVKRKQGGFVTTLLGARVGGAVYPAPLPPLVATLTVDPADIVTPGAPRPPGMPPPTYHINFKLHVAATGAPVTVTEGGDHVDFVIRDQGGREVYRWTTGKMFAQYIRQVTIDQTGIDYTGTLDTQQVWFGTNTVEGIAKISSAPAPATATLTVIPGP